jgi:hypothetical protein
VENIIPKVSPMTVALIKPKPNWKEVRCPVEHCRAYHWGDVTVFVGQEPQIGWHLSISTPYRYPTWDEIKAARYDLIPNEVTVAMFLPPREEYVNAHQFCFHLHQVPDESVLLNLAAKVRV